MRIKRLTLNNIGSFAGEHSFLFQTDNSQKQIVLIGGRNGAGKTTLFESIRLCLTVLSINLSKKTDCLMLCSILSATPASPTS